MKYLQIILIPIILVVFLGCSQKTEVITKIVYRDKICPSPKPKPIFKPYELVILHINNTDYYALPKSEAIKMSTNWISYKEWAEANYFLMKMSSENNNSGE